MGWVHNRPESLSFICEGLVPDRDHDDCASLLFQTGRHFSGVSTSFCCDSATVETGLRSLDTRSSFGPKR